MRKRFCKKCTIANIAGLGIILVLVVSFFIFYLADEPDDGSDSAGEHVSTFEDLAPHFRDEMLASGVSRMGQPIHGFNAFLLLGAFSGLLEEDFQDVESFEGMYEFTGSELLHVRTKDQPITSAEDTVSDKGYETLLQNVSERLKMGVESEEDVEDVVDMLIAGDQVAIRCASEQRDVDACIEIYQPVCGQPLNKTFSNSCFACQNELVESYSLGECIGE